ncbi:hypothetical protein DMENIID0001_011930 [Sergentomyia squamirostris]
MTENFNNLAVQIADLLNNKSVGEIIKLFEVPSNAFLFEVILRKIADRMKNGVKLSLKEKKCLIENLMRNSYDPNLTDLLFNILEINDEEPPAKRKKLSDVIQSGGGDEITQTSSAMEMEPERNNIDHVENNASGDEETTNAEGSSNAEEDGTPDFQENVSDNHELLKPVQVIQKEKTYNDRFKSTQLEIQFTLRRPHGDNTIGPNDKVILHIYHPDNSAHKPVYIGMRRVDTLSNDVILQSMEMIHQSTSAFHSSDVLGARASILHDQEGRGRNYRPKGMNFQDMRKYKQKSIIDPGAPENCLLISLVFGMVLLIASKTECMKKIQRLRNSPSKKKLQFTFNKRRCIEDSETEPFGY